MTPGKVVKSGGKDKCSWIDFDHTMWRMEILRGGDGWMKEYGDVNLSGRHPLLVSSFDKKIATSYLNWLLLNLI